MIGILLPVYIFLLQSPDSASSPSTLHAQAVAQILSLASAAPAAFRDATAKLEQKQREALEAAVRKAMGASSTSAGQKSGVDAAGSKPKIELRSF